MTPDTMRSPSGSPNTELAPPNVLAGRARSEQRHAAAERRPRLIARAGLAGSGTDLRTPRPSQPRAIGGRCRRGRAHCAPARLYGRGSTFDAAVNGHAFGDDVALDHAGVADGQRTAAHIAFDLAVDLQFGAVGFHRAGDLHAIGDDRRDAAYGPSGFCVEWVGSGSVGIVVVVVCGLSLFVNMPSCP